MKVGNIVHAEVPISKDEKFNKCVNRFYPNGRVEGEDFPAVEFNKVDRSYQEINEMFELSDLKRGQKVSGHRGYYLKHNGLKLAMALTNYGLDFLEN